MTDAPTPASSPALTATRTALHRLAEHVLAAELHRHTGKIGLRAAPGGFATPAFTVDGATRQVRVEGTELVVQHGEERRSAPITTLRAAGELVGVEPVGPAGVYTLQTDPDPDLPLEVDPEAAAEIAALFALTHDALVELVGRSGVDGRDADAGAAPTAQLWPEHFDLGVSLGEVNYGGSPGDEGHDRPYLYVGPWTARTGAFWNEPFGASVPAAGLGVDGALAFFEEGQRIADLDLDVGQPER